MGNVVRHLQRAGLRAAAMDGERDQGHRVRVLDDFRTARNLVLVATDIAARGLHVDDVARVINYDLTREQETYVHRVGRTERAGAGGVAVTFCTAAERRDLQAIEALIRSPLQRADGGRAPARERGGRRRRRVRAPQPPTQTPWTARQSPTPEENTGMTPDEIEQLRQQLEAEKAEYEETLGTSLEAAEGEELDQQRVGRLSRMDALQSQSILRAANQRIVGEIQQIDLALERIKRGTYGKCHSCEREIGLARLQALPATLHCVDCARRGG